ncbi:hypothetical protein MKK69_04830 [Methylobacterium sp. J-026]|uniref:hypothetical protein n=1 Tax=Methylobacterium sp. J-026 TaxID=2836624 RepID=UPI001FB87A4E|nr:hypothetical protein [Methylobacterium sp. J-026]MCJ2133392.1 hypothetical protein [Methylobacterium sp. J-026]
MTTPDDPLIAFRARIAAAPKPVEPRTDAEIYDEIRAAFAALWGTIDAMDAIVRAGYHPEAKVYICIPFVNRINETMVGEFRAERPGHSLQETRTRAIPFTFQGNEVWIRDGAFSDVADLRGEMGARFAAASQDRLAARMAEVVSDFFETGL